MRFRQAEALGEMAADDSPSKFRPPEGCRRWPFGQGELNIVIAQKLPEPRCVALGWSNEDDLFRFPGLKLLDQRLERGLFPVPGGFLASVGGQIRFDRARHLLRSLRSHPSWLKHPASASIRSEQSNQINVSTGR